MSTSADPPLTGLAIVRRLAILLVAAGVAVNLLLLLLPDKRSRENVFDHLGQVLQVRGADDSWGAMEAALNQFAAAPATPLYTEMFFTRQYRFQYPPSSLLGLMALRLAGPERVRTTDEAVFAPWPAVNDMLGVLFIVLTAAAAAGVLELSLRRQSGFVDRPGFVWARVALVFLVTFTFYPVVKAYTLGQIQVWINGLFALALFAWVYGLRAVAGALMGLCCLIKPHYGLLVLWALMRREWSFLVAGAVVAGAGLVVSVAVFGWANHIDYLQVLQFLSAHGEAYYPNHSVNGLLNRLLLVGGPDNDLILDFPAGRFPPFTPLVYGATLATSAGLILYGLLRSAPPQDRPRDFARMALCSTMASPIAWEHHYGILLPIFMLLLADRANTTRSVALLVAYFLSANFFVVLNGLATTYWNPLESYVLVAAVIVLILLDRGGELWRPGRFWAQRRSAEGQATVA